MRHAPAFVMEVYPDPRWERAVMVLRGLAWLWVLTWLGWHCLALALALPLTSWSPELGWRMAAAVLLGMALWSTRSTASLPTGACLAWQPAHTGGWLVLPNNASPSGANSPDPSTPPSPLPLQLSCLCDGGHWLLLRLTPATPSSPVPGAAFSHIARHAHRSQWLALRQHDHPQHWHRLRCALFTPGL